MTHLDILGTIGVSIIAASLLALAVRRIGQPLIIGYILGGVLIGPHMGLRLVTDEPSIELISEMGLILLLFIVGLEINIPQLRQASRAIAVAGILQFPLCAVLTWAVVGPLADLTGGRFDRLYLTLALGLSSTLIVVKLLADKFELSTFGGRVTVGILIFQDLWAIAFLAFQPNLGGVHPAELLRAVLAGAGLVGAAALLSRFVLPTLFRGIARSTELMLLTSMGWCFLVAGVAGAAGLSKEMGALIAGMVIAGFPYGTEVVARLTGVRDFFITLFFVALGLKAPLPTPRLVAIAAAAAVFVALSRFIVLVPLLTLLRIDVRTAGVVSTNLSQVGEFGLVAVALGASYGHVSAEVAAIILFALLATAVTSTYGILWNHELASALARLVASTGLPQWIGHGRRPERPPATPARQEPDLFFVGVSREGLAFIQHLERESPAMKARIVAIDFNPETLERLQADGVECHYGDIASGATLSHAGIDRAGIVVSCVSDWFLKGIDNRRLIRLIKGLAPQARIIATADTLVQAETLYAEGAAYVLIPPALAAGHLYRLLRNPSPDALETAARADHAVHGLVSAVG
jgi:Kef-type K+ transport system membrane component KefB